MFRQHYDTDALDASTLLIPLVRFLPPEDERVRSDRARDRRRAHRARLRAALPVPRRPTTACPATEGTFLICSFWLVSALSEIGESSAPRSLCERLLSHASPLGLYAEELDARSGRHLGNYPQAFTHLALINAVLHVISDEEAPA